MTISEDKVIAAEEVWEHKDEWHRSGKNFTIVVKHHSTTPSLSPAEGPHRWAVYAYIYPQHRLFASFCQSSNQAALELPLHCGPSFLRWHTGEDGEYSSVQVGADYHHLHDDRFSNYASKDEAEEVFRDAGKLFDYLGAAEHEGKQS